MSIKNSVNFIVAVLGFSQIGFAENLVRSESSSLKSIWTCATANSSTQLILAEAKDGTIVVNMKSARLSHGAIFKAVLIPRRPGSEGPTRYASEGFTLSIQTGLAPQNGYYTANLESNLTSDTTILCSPRN